MKITIITPTMNSEKTILDTLDSISLQTYKNIEHVIVDGGSKDSTLQILRSYKKKKLKIYQKKTNIYQAINFGIKKSTGKIIGILGSDDIYQNENVIKTVINNFNTKFNIDILIGSLAYFSGKNFSKITRYYQNNNFSENQFKYGMMPPHPSTFIKRDVYKKVGLYNENIMISSDFDFFLRSIYKKKIYFKFLNKIIVRMRMGGISTKNFLAPLKITMEIRKILKSHQIYTNYYFVFFRLLLKLKQFIFSKHKVNSDYKLIKSIKERSKEESSFKIVKSPNVLIKRNDNFVLSALNLAFLGYFGVAKVKQYKNLYHWPDGYYAKQYYPNINKIPGRILIKKIKDHENIKTIHVIGNINEKNKEFLKKKFSGKKIKNSPLPILKEENIEKYSPKIYSGELIFITLPTPKQELMAEYLIKKNKNYKIICIGASLNLVSNVEKPVPNFMYQLNLEWLWRLRTDTKRRTMRILQTYRYYLKSYFKGVYSNLNFR